MSTHLHDALADLAEDIGPDDVQSGLAGSAWTVGRRRRPVPTLALVAAAAAVVIVAWLALTATGRPDARPAAGYTDTALPQRVALQRDPGPLPAQGQPLAAVVEVGSTDGTQGTELPVGERDTTNEGTRWQAITPDGRLWSLEGAVAPGAATLAEDEMAVLTAAPALSPDGTKVALAQTVRPVGTGSQEPAEDLRSVLDVHDVVTGEHRAYEQDCDARCSPVTQLRWSRGGGALAALAQDGSRTVLRMYYPDEQGQGRAVSLEDSSVTLAGWLDETHAVLVAVTEEGQVSVEGRLRPLLVGSSFGEINRLDPQPARVTQPGTSRADTVTTFEDGLAVLDPRLGDTLTWQTYTLPRGSGADSGVGITLDLVGSADGTPHLTETPGAGIAVALPSVVLRSTMTHGDEVLTVVDPGLEPQDLVIAAEAARTDRHGATSVLGTRTGWWAWHPWLAAGSVVGGLALLAVLVRRTGRARGRRRARR